MNETPLQVFTSLDGQYHFNILGALDEPSEYVNLFQLLRDALAEDVINIYLNTPGGRVDTMIQIIICMNNSEATIVTHLEGLCHSAGTYIFLSGDEWVVNPNTLLLFHNYSGGAAGKGNEIIANVLANDVWIKQINDNIYYPFLSREEIDSINSDKDVWMNSDEVSKRLETVIAYRESLATKEAVKARIALKDQIDTLVQNDIALSEQERALEEVRMALSIEEEIEEEERLVLEALERIEKLKGG